MNIPESDQKVSQNLGLELSREYGELFYMKGCPDRKLTTLSGSAKPYENVLR